MSVKFVTFAPSASHRASTYSEYGKAAIIAYQLYQFPPYVSLAQLSWEIANRFTVSPDEIASGSSPDKNFKLISECQSCKCTYGCIMILYRYSHPELKLRWQGGLFRFARIDTALSPNSLRRLRKPTQVIHG